MRVVMVSTDRKMFDPGSAVSRRTIALGDLLENLHIIVFTRKEENFQVTKLGAHITVYPTNSIARRHYVQDAVPLARLAGKIDIVTAQDPFEIGLAALRIAREAKVPLQLQIHTDFTAPAFRRESLLNRIRVHIARYTIPRAQCVRAVSPRIVHSIEPLIEDHTSRPSIIPVYTEVSNVIAAQPVNLHIAHPKFNFFVVMVSRLTREKNIGVALEAINFLRVKHPQIALLIVGDGPEKAWLVRKAHTLGIADRVFFLGWMPNPYGIMKGASVFLSTSLYEGYGMSLIEAAAAHVPIVTTDVGIVGDVLKNDIHCLVCPIGNPAFVATQIDRFIGDNIFREKTSLAASEAVYALAEKTVAQYAAEIKETLTTCASGTTSESKTA